MTAKVSSNPVPGLEHRAGPESVRFDWNDLQLFLLVADSGSLRGASQNANMSVNSLRRRLHQLEKKMSCRLFVRDSFGAHLTESGERLMRASIGMQAAAAEVAAEISRVQLNRSNRVVIGVSDGLDSFWLQRKLAELKCIRGDLQIELQCHPTPPNVYAMQVDVSVQHTQPDHANLIVARLAHMHEQYFASSSYLSQKGVPGSMIDLQRHDRVVLADPPFDNDDAFEITATDAVGSSLIKVRSVAAQVEAMGNQLGIGLLPTYVAASKGGLTSILNHHNRRHAIYLTYRRDIGQQGHVRSVINWLKEAFDSRKYPWFGETYVPPPPGGFAGIGG